MAQGLEEENSLGSRKEDEVSGRRRKAQEAVRRKDGGAGKSIRAGRRRKD